MDTSKDRKEYNGSFEERSGFADTSEQNQADLDARLLGNREHAPETKSFDEVNKTPETDPLRNAEVVVEGATVVTPDGVDTVATRQITEMMDNAGESPAAKLEALLNGEIDPSDMSSVMEAVNSAADTE